MHTSCVLLSHVPPPFCRISCVHRHRCYCCQHLHKRKRINTAAVRNLNGAHRCTEWIENTRGQIQPFVVLTHSWHSKGQKCIQPLPTISITDQIMTSAHECAPCIDKFQLSTFSFSAAHCAEQDSETKLCRSHFGHLCSHVWNAQDHWNPGKANHCTDKKTHARMKTAGESPERVVVPVCHLLLQQRTEGHWSAPPALVALAPLVATAPPCGATKELKKNMWEKYKFKPSSMWPQTTKSQ